MLMTKRFGMWDMDRAFEQMNRVFDAMSRPVNVRSIPAGTFPAINVYDVDGKLVVTAELPGVNPSDLDLQVIDNNLTLSGNRQEETLEEGEKYYRKERTHGRFTRTISLPEKINPDAVTATYTNGILRIELPKAEEVKAKSIDIQSN